MLVFTGVMFMVNLIIGAINLKEGKFGWATMQLGFAVYFMLYTLFLMGGLI